ncbi:YgzB family protein [Haloferax sp. S2CR25-2]|nr:YgzB family protein [Haloferax sp. S2CR25]MDS0444924.1 YgzB family protein [Haloferax sp. S2CR25-2]
MTVECPACGHESKTLFRCDYCGHDLVRGDQR